MSDEGIALRPDLRERLEAISRKRAEKEAEEKAAQKILRRKIIGVLIRGDFFDTSLLPAAVTEAGVDGNAVQPGREGSSFLKTVYTGECLEERFLSQFEGIIMVSGHSEEEGENAVLVKVHEYAEGITIAVAAPVDEFCFINVQCTASRAAHYSPSPELFSTSGHTLMS